MSTDAVIEQIEKAYRLVCDLCQPKGSAGSREWTMSIPARPDYDPDLVIGGALRYAESLIKTQAEENKRLREDLRLLNALRAAGVDNWEGYDMAREMMPGEEE